MAHLFGAQLSVEVGSPNLCVLRVAGVLDKATVGRLAGLVATRVARPGSSGHVVVDLGEVSFFATDDFGVLRRARDGARAAGIQLHLAGLSAREPLLPEGITAALEEFSSFPTVERAELELTGRAATLAGVGRPRSSHGWPCQSVPVVDDGRETRPGTSLTG